MKGLFVVVTSILICLSAPVFAACPVTHAYLTKLFFKKFPKYTKAEEQDFMVGTLFPDIRVLGVLIRNETHYDTMTLLEVLKETNPFKAGLKFHSYVDLVREQLLVGDNVYGRLRKNESTALKKTLSDDYLISAYLKLVEDEFLYPHEVWSDVSFALIHTHALERQYGIPETELIKWHKLLNLLFISSPSNSLSFFTLTGRGALSLTPQDVKAWNENLKPFLKDPVVLDWMDHMVSHFEKEFDYYKKAKVIPKHDLKVEFNRIHFH